MTTPALGPLQRWPHRLPVTLHSPVWPGMLATLAILGLLLAFQQVAREAVQRGELRRVATAAHAEAAWRCNALSDRGVRDDCLAQLDAAARDGAVLQARNVER